MNPLIIVLMCAVSGVIASCSERAEEPQGHMLDVTWGDLGEEPPHGAISRGRQPAFGMYVAVLDTTECEDAQAFRNWVAKAHPNVWHEYYATHCGDSL